MEEEPESVPERSLGQNLPMVNNKFVYQLLIKTDQAFHGRVAAITENQDNDKNKCYNRSTSRTPLL